MDELQQVRRPVGAKKVVREAPDVGIVYCVVGRALLDQRREPGLIRQPARKLDTEIDHAARCRGVMGIRWNVRPARIDLVTGPDSGEVGLAIRQPRRGGGHVDVAVSLPGCSRSGITNPLSGQRTRCKRANDYQETGGENGCRAVQKKRHPSRLSESCRSSGNSSTRCESDLYRPAPANTNFWRRAPPKSSAT